MSDQFGSCNVYLPTKHECTYSANLDTDEILHKQHLITKPTWRQNGMKHGEWEAYCWRWAQTLRISSTPSSACTLSSAGTWSSFCALSTSILNFNIKPTSCSLCCNHASFSLIPSNYEHLYHSKPRTDEWHDKVKPTDVPRQPECNASSFSSSFLYSQEIRCQNEWFEEI